LTSSWISHTTIGQAPERTHGRTVGHVAFCSVDVELEERRRRADLGHVGVRRPDLHRLRASADTLVPIGAVPMVVVLRAAPSATWATPTDRDGLSARFASGRDD
jgi:hypothetical protein